MKPYALFLLHLLLTWFMTGLIWMVQLVHYPLFSYVEQSRFVAFVAQHTMRISWIVMPVMILELGTACYLVWLSAPPLQGTMAWANLVLLGGIWLGTFFLSVPQHAQLQQGFSSDAHQLLVSTNWIRTFLWSGRAALLGCIALQWGARST